MTELDPKVIEIFERAKRKQARNANTDQEPGPKRERKKRPEPERHADPPERSVDIEALAKSARPLIHCENILGRFIVDFRKVIAGEERNARLLYLIATSRLLGKTMHAAIKGTSAGGKSQMRAQVLEYFPPEDVVSFTSLSEKFLIYYEGDFAHKILSMGEAVATDEQNFQDYLLRELMTEGRLRHNTVQRNGNEIVSQTIEKEGPVSFLVTTTKSKLHPENETRMLSLEIDDSERQTKAVLRKVAEVEGLNRASGAVDYELWRDFQRWLAAGERRVVVPFAAAMVDLIPPASVRLRRDIGQVIRAIKVHALLHREHRARDELGQIVADVEDYANVRALMNDLLAESSGVAINPTIAETIKAVETATRALPPEQGVTASEIGKLLNLDKSAARRRLLSAVGEGFVTNLEVRRGQPGRYRATGQVIEAAVMLPEPEEIAVPPRTPRKPVPPKPPATQSVEDNDQAGGKAFDHHTPPAEPVATRLQPVETAIATDSALSDQEKMPPVARWQATLTPAGAKHGSASDPIAARQAELLGMDGWAAEEPDEVARVCAHCGKVGQLLETHDSGQRVVYLHRGCLDDWRGLDIPSFLDRRGAA
jgi:hypothetical protein